MARSRDRMRDHRSRDSIPAAFCMVLAASRAAERDPWLLFGNHVVIDLGGGVHAVLAHLRRGTIRVRPGDRVTGGQPIGQCGNSGNSSEPHLHFQLMDGPDVAVAKGLPFCWSFEVAESLHSGVPRAQEPFVAPEPD
ncbi:murein DD-endopeptidase MepM/ murein hydrolase activator NlpD [Spinactinospora alkalitolerans]|uniref:Murein DD-endopeptidase MepM/ murein hydrolase activator NlpD n=1 Tax=Spinactinospora alkalitolerans TaxID=687207 RepID=A0A852TN24_9ACTN|nr:murein DD-endopeptidase MepM/ murein hydrolase activator NlpD [Spinactinospora alkalitolerans]